MKILIIDDEISTRESIKVLAGFNENFGDEIFEAKNGMEGYGLIEKVRPDIIFLDMNMPIMDGVDFLKLLDGKKFTSKIIVVSGYTDFRYTKAAILQEYVIDYIQKPIDEKQIRDAVKKATGMEVRNGKKNKTAEKQDRAICGVFVEEFPKILKNNFNNSLELFEYFMTSQMEHQIENAEFYPYSNHVYRYAFFFTIPEKECHGLEIKLGRLVKSMEERYGICIYVIFSEETGIDNRDCMGFCEYLNYIDLNKGGRVFQKEKAEQIQEAGSNPGLWAGNLVYYAENQNREYFDKTVKNMLNELCREGKLTIYEIKNFLSGLLHEMGKKLNMKESGNQIFFSDKMGEIYSDLFLFTREYSCKWLENFFEEIWNRVQKEDTEIPDKLRKILCYIQGNYEKKISLSDVAKRFYFNSSTVSRMFVKYLGINYIDYLNTLRLEKAKELLELPEISISLAAEKTGFESLSYFSKQFKKKYGISPQEYRKK